MGRLSKYMKSQNLAKPKDFFMSSGYLNHNTEGYVPEPGSLVVQSRPPPAERTAEDGPFFLVPRNPDDPCVQVDISPGSVSVSAS